MHEAIRQFAQALLAGPDLEAARDHHALAYLELATEEEAHLRGPRQVEWLDRLEDESINFAAALERLGGSEADHPAALALVTAMRWYWFHRGRTREAVDILESCGDRCGWGRPAGGGAGWWWRAGAGRVGQGRAAGGVLGVLFGSWWGFGLFRGR